MTEQVEAKANSGWNAFMRKHWAAFAVFIFAALLAAVDAVYVFVWFVGNAQSTGLVPASIGLWSMANVVFFILHAAFWELLLVGVPVAVGAVVGWQWWKRVPEQEKQQYNLSTKGSKSSRAGGAISPLMFLSFAIKVYVDGNWSQAISTYTLNYVVGSLVTILAWTAAIFAVPAVVGLVWWIHRETKKP